MDKICAYCFRIVPKLNFGVYRNQPDYYCYNCRKEYIELSKKKIKIKREEFNLNGFQFCLKCKVILQRENFSFDCNGNIGLNKYCKNCCSILGKNICEKNKLKIKK